MNVTWLPSERPGAGCVCGAEQESEEEAHHPDSALAGGVPVHAGLCRTSAALLQDSTGNAAPPLQVCGRRIIK